MEKTAIYRIPYGLYYLGARSGDRQNICVVNTVQQVTDTPQRISVTVLKSNLTCEMIAASGTFSAAILDMDSTMEDIARFGQQSGRDTDKLANMEVETDALGNPVYAKNCAAVLSAAVTEQIDLGTHMLFVGEVKDAAVLTDKTPITYAEYRARKAGKAPASAKTEEKAAVYQCSVCHYVYDGDIPFEELPDDYICPICKKPKSVFVKM